MVITTKKEVDRQKSESIWSFVNGLIMAAIGVYMWFKPEEALMSSGLYLGVALIVVGAIYLKNFNLWSFGWHLALGLTNILVGIILATNLGVTADTFIIIIGMWGLFIGIIQVTSASRLRSVSFRWSLILAAGLLGILFGFMVVSYPLTAFMKLSTMISIYLAIYGALEIVNYTFKSDIQV